jgi:hypothetical protein
MTPISGSTAEPLGLLRPDAGERRLVTVTALPFDPDSPGARRLARTWLPELERWEMRVPGGHFFRLDKDQVVEAGQTIAVGAPAGKLLRERGYELVGITRMHRGV